ncbi:MAG: hypothetical protein ABFE01_15625 [Phycisphaerales bacterium]|jgi:hypothetical protein
MHNAKQRDLVQSHLPAKMILALELLPSLDFSFVKAGRIAGYSRSYCTKLAGRFARDKRLQQALHERMQKLLAETGQSDRNIVERVLQTQHLKEHPIAGSFLTGKSPWA